jgi:SPX domain protein involved in polyphosphate accumulation
MIIRAAPALEGDKLVKAAFLLFRMHELVVHHKLAPCVRSVYKRAAFQSPQSNGESCSNSTSTRYTTLNTSHSHFVS